MEKILLIRFGSLGDVILSSATVSNLRVLFPAAKIVYLTREQFRGTVELIDSVDEIVTISDDCSLSELFMILVRLDRQDFSAVIDLHGNMRSWFARKIITANHTAVYPKRRIERLRMTKQRTLPKTWPHTIDLYNRTVSSLGGRVHCKRPLLRIPEQLSADIDSPITTSTVAIAPGAAHDNKQFPLERFAELARLLSLEPDLSIIWLLTKKDAALLDSFDGNNKIVGARLIDRPITELAAVIGRCGLTIANDSGIAHLSSSLGTPTLAIFGPTHPALGFAPAGLRDLVMGSDQFCRPCSRHGGKRCYREERFCFSEISTDDILDNAKSIFRAQAQTERALFIDRDGTLLVNKHYLSDPDEVEFENGAVEALHLAKEKGYKIVIVSNQSGVARGYFTLEQMEKVNARMIEMLASEKIVCDDIQYCPHYPDSSVTSEFSRECDCRKPSPGMVEKAALRLNLDLRRSYVIGDSIDDYHLARVTGATPLIVRTGHGKKTEASLAKLSQGQSGLWYDHLLAAAQSLPPVTTLS